MPTVNVRPSSHAELQEIADTMAKSRKVIVVTGAGISTNCGIPDFRSENGLYSMIQAQYDAALRNPPWQNKDEYDIDDRPQKKRRRWYYEVVRREDGEVVQVIDDELEQSSQEPSQNDTPRTRSPSPRQQQTDGKPCSSPLSSPPTTPTETPSLFTNASSVASTRSGSPEPSEPVVEASQTSQASRPDLPNLKGRDLFDSMVWKDPFTTSIFYMFITKFRQTIKEDVATLSPSHLFLKTLRDGGRLVRNYTQNIDCLEERMGFNTELDRGPGNRARFAMVQRRQRRPDVIEQDSTFDGGVECVQLHGSLQYLRCGICAKLCSWDEPIRLSATLSGSAPDCPACTSYSQQRAGKGRRGLAVGRLRPDIVLYGEEHPSASLVAPIITHDLGLNPDVLLILGTSLRVHGLKVMVKEFAKAVHGRGGKVIFVNHTKPPESTWGDVIDYWVGWDCDEWVLDLKKRRSDIWLSQGEALEETKSRRESAIESKNVKESADDGKTARKRASRPQCVRDDKMNGVYHTFKILDLLGQIPDGKGSTATRTLYWEKPVRRSLGVTDTQQIFESVSVEIVSSLAPAKQDTLTVQQPISKKRKSLSTTQASKSTHVANSSKPRRPRKSCPAVIQDEKRDAIRASHWDKLRQIAPSLGETPPACGRIPLHELTANLLPCMRAYANAFPSQFQWAVADRVPMPSLITHPPSGLTIPMHTPHRDPPKHAYGTRAKRNFADTIDVAAQLPTPASTQEATPPNSSPPRTPDSARIKNMGSISAILSSPEDSQGSSNDVYYDAEETLIAL